MGSCAKNPLPPQVVSQSECADHTVSETISELALPTTSVPLSATNCPAGKQDRWETRSSGLQSKCGENGGGKQSVCRATTESMCDTARGASTKPSALFEPTRRTIRCMTTALETLAPDQVCHQHTAPVRLIAFGPENRWLTADTDSQIVFWKGDTAETFVDQRSANPRFRPHDRVRSAVFALDGRSAFAACGNRLLSLDADTGEELWRYRAAEFWPFMLGGPTCLSLNAAGGLVAAFDNGSLERFEDDHRRAFVRKSRFAPVWFRLDAASGRLVGCDGYTVTTWDQDDGKMTAKQRLDDHAFAFDYAFSSDTAVIRDAGKVVAWRLADGDLVAEIDVEPAPPIVVFSPGGSWLAYADGAELVVSGFGGLPTIRIADSSRFVTARFQDEQTLFTGHGDGTVKVWPLR